MSLSQRPLVYLITDGRLTAANFAEQSQRTLRLIATAVSCSLPLVQIREKGLATRQLFDLTAKAAEICEGTDTTLLVNDRADVAVAAGAGGVHLTAGSLPVGTVKALFPEFVVGVSAHSVEEVEAASRDGADFAVFGPVFATPGKGPAIGIEPLRSIASRVAPFPVLGLGGVDGTNHEEVCRASAGFAAIRFLNDEPTLARLSGR